MPYRPPPKKTLAPTLGAQRPKTPKVPPPSAPVDGAGGGRSSLPLTPGGGSTDGTGNGYNSLPPTPVPHSPNSGGATPPPSPPVVTSTPGAPFPTYEGDMPMPLPYQMDQPITYGEAPQYPDQQLGSGLLALLRNLRLR